LEVVTEMRKFMICVIDSKTHTSLENYLLEVSDNDFLES
jgi:hypothetical protein